VDKSRQRSAPGASGLPRVILDFKISELDSSRKWGIGEMRKARIVSTRLQPASQAVQAKAGRRLRAAVVSCGLGFVAGAVFWHFVGFWSYLSEQILDRTLGANAAFALAAPKPTAADQPAIVVVDTNRCTMLTLDRRSNSTLAQPCPTTDLALRFEPHPGVREDMAGRGQRQLQAVGYRTD